MKYFVLAAAIVMYALVIAFPKHKSKFALGAALVMVIAGAASPSEVLFEFIDWNIMLIFMGSLIIAELFIYSRVPAVIADRLIINSPNAGVAIVAILVMTGFISAFVENVATVLVMAPIALAFCDKLKMNPRMFMTGLAVMANLQGTATLVGDPPSMIFANYAKYSFNDFFVYHGKPSIFFAVQLGMVVGALFFYAYFARTKARRTEFEQEKVLTPTPAILLILMIGGLAAASFVFGGLTIGSGILVMGLGVFGLLWYGIIRREGGSKAWDLVKNLDWDTALFLVGIFAVIGAIAGTGLLEDFAAFLERIIGTNVALGFILIVAVSIAISGFVDNVPYIIVMLPVAASISASLGLNKELYMFALLIGSCMGGNLTPFGASANVVTMGILRQQGVHMTFGQWLKIGIPFTLLTTATSAAFLWFIWRH